MMDWKDVTEDSLFTAGQEQEGSQKSYDRRIEIQRRNFLRENNLAAAQITAAKAMTDTAKWTKVSAICVGISAVIALIAFLYSIIAT